MVEFVRMSFNLRTLIIMDNYRGEIWKKKCIIMLLHEEWTLDSISRVSVIGNVFNLIKEYISYFVYIYVPNVTTFT